MRGREGKQRVVRSAAARDWRSGESGTHELRNEAVLRGWATQSLSGSGMGEAGQQERNGWIRDRRSRVLENPTSPRRQRPCMHRPRRYAARREPHSSGFCGTDQSSTRLRFASRIHRATLNSVELLQQFCPPQNLSSAEVNNTVRQNMKTLAYMVAVFVLLPFDLLRAADDTNSFVDHFGDAENILGYVALIDGLIDVGEAKIYASIEDEGKEHPLPRAKTQNGIRMVYTVTRTPEGVLVHFSTSRAPYLPTAFGKHIVGLFMVRAGWPKPTMFEVSERHVFHAYWVVPDAEFTQIQSALPQLRAKIRSSEDAKSAFLNGLLRSNELETEPNLESLVPTPASVTPAADATVARGEWSGSFMAFSFLSS